MAMIKCPNCGEEIKKGSKACSECGSMIRNESNNSKKKIVIKIVLAVITIGLVIGGIIFYNEYQKQKAEEKVAEYEERLESLIRTMLDGAAESEKCGNLILDVWHNTIWEEDDEETDKYTKVNGVFNDDFNDSLETLYEDADFVASRSEISDNKSRVNRRIKDMKDYPDEWEEAYEDLKEFHDAYLEMTNLCLNPSGSYNSYSSNFNDIDSKTLNAYEKAKSHID